MRVLMRVMCLLCGIGLVACGKVSDSQVETHKVVRGNFLNQVTVTGELDAVQSKMISAPPINWRFGQLKIAKLVEDGKQVQENDLMIQFDKGEVEKAITEAKSNLEISEAELRKAQVKHKSEIESMEIDLEIARINHQINKLKLEQATFKADIDRKQDEFNLEDAAIKMEQAAQELENKKDIHKQEISKLELKVNQEKANLREAEETLALLTVMAPSPGIAIIQRNWMTNNKFQVDDQTYPGYSMIGLPDLSQMKAVVEINEIDIAKVKVDQKTLVTLDAYPDTTFTGRVSEIATLARNKSRDVKVKVFDVTVLLDGSDERLLPGLTVSCDIIVDEVPQVLSIPVAAVFDREGKSVVFRRSGGGFAQQLVTLGAENDTYVLVENGLSEGDEIALADPTVKAVSTLSAKGEKK